MDENFLTSKTLSIVDMGGVADLLCPRCGADYLHHSAVTVYDRAEDASTVIETEVSNGRVSVNPYSSGVANPSRRRDGVIIDFYCEGCGDAPIQLCIAQHKGATEIGWRFAQAL